MKPNDKINEYIDRIERCIPKIIRTVPLSVPREIAGLKFTVSQVLTLASLFRKDVWKMTELAENVNVNLSTMTGIIDGLIQTELVERKRDAKDHRSVLVYLTSKGKKVANKIRANRKRKTRSIIEYLDEDRREAIISGFESAVEAISIRTEKKK